MDLNPRQILRLGLGWMPHAALLPLYHASSRVAVRELAKTNRGLKVWTRNSYRLNRLEPLLSDIDLTVFASERLSLAEVESLKERHRQLRRIFPVLGEMNLIPSTWQGSIVKHINPEELSRDPELSAHSDSLARRASTALSRFYFLMRAIESDLNNLIYFPASRVRKWQGHFVDLRLEPLRVHELSLATLLERSFALLPELPRSEREKARHEIEYYFRTKVSRHTHRALDRQLSSLPWVWSLFLNRFSFVMDSRPAYLSDIQIVLLDELMHWEIFAAFTQHLLISSRDIFPSHLKNLRTQTEPFGVRSEIQTGIESFLAEAARLEVDRSATV